MTPLRIEERGQERWILLAGEMYHEEVLRLKDVLDRAAMQASGAVVVDLGGVTFIVSLGYGVIVSARERFAARGLTLRLANVPDPVERTLRTMRLAHDFERA
ncbi:MAG TPA: STAS domain-containing protein [Candidatus Eisenbacteria bacterium]|nr:STAS domain-containing protein [Candidatus Eisenbacteria bacterium]